jgi:hypothetical protein
MLNRFDLQREVNSLDMLISALSSEIIREPDYNTARESPSVLLREMEEALLRLRQARGLRKILLTALENSCDITIYKRQAASTMRRKQNMVHSSTCQL